MTDLHTLIWTVVLIFLCFQAFKEMLYEALEQAPSAEGRLFFLAHLGEGCYDDSLSVVIIISPSVHNL